MALVQLAGSPRVAAPQFSEMLPVSGIDYLNVSGEPDKRFIVSSLGSGVAMLDYDEDGDLDLYFVNGMAVEGTEPTATGSDRLYRNEGDWKFVDVSDAAGVAHEGWGLGCAVGDFDNDGFDDLYVTQIGGNVFYRNRGDGTFDNVSESAGVAHPGFGTSAAFFDGDGDGALDLYVANYSEADIAALPLPGERPSCVWFGLPVFCGPSGLEAEADTFFRNNGEAAFTESTAEVGLQVSMAAYGLGVVSGDIDGDGDVDLYVANDSVPNFLFENDGTGKFEETGLFAGVAYNADGLAQAGMGVDLADLDGDGLLDLVVTNFSHDTNTVYRNTGDGLFADVTTVVDMRVPTWFYLGWAVRGEDFDNDGFIDIFAVNGHVYPDAADAGQSTQYRQRNQLFWGGDQKLAEREWPTGDGMLAEASGRGAAFGDLDDDGDVDVVIVNIDDVPALLRNDSGGRSLTLRLIGTRMNRSAVGARVTATIGGARRVYEVRPSGSFLSSNDPRIHIGLGDGAHVERLEVGWPGGERSQLFDELEEGGITLVEGRAGAMRTR